VSLSEAWLVQAASDHESIGRVFERERPNSYCQALAKCQQSVEKAVKSASFPPSEGLTTPYPFQLK